MPTIDSNDIMQVGVVVRDIDRTAAIYAKLFGIDPPNIRPVFPTITYRGKAVTTRARLCAMKMGPVTLELIEPDETDTSWKEYLDAHGQGVHHVAVVVDDLDGAREAMAAEGIEVRQFGGAQWGSYSFMDSEDLLGVNISLKCNTPVE